MKARILDRARLSAQIRRKMGRESLRTHEAFSGIDKSTLSRALNGKPLTDANFMAVCMYFAINPVKLMRVAPPQGEQR